MAKEHVIKITAHPSIYQYNEREITIRFSEPEEGISSETGLLLIIPDIGQSPDTEDSVMLRNEIADKYNVVTIQCEYFGLEFMGGIKNPQFQFDYNTLKSALSEEDFHYIYQNEGVDVNRLLDVGSKYPIIMNGNEQLNESPGNYNDLGLMQALDHLTAVLVTAEVLKDNGYSFHAGKVIAYGTGHGAYLAYLCNAFAPKLFTLVIDNSAWLFPPYFTNNRTLSFKRNLLQITVMFDYLAKRLPYDKELLQLNKLYKKFMNRANILSFHGESDQTTSAKKKSDFCQSIPYCMCNEINKNQLKEGVFSTTDRNLGANPTQLIEYVMDNLSIQFEPSKELQLPLTIINTNEYRYTFDYASGVPLLTRTSKKSHGI